MTPTVLLVSTATLWLGTPRIPRDLAHAGWNVALLAPKGSLADHSRYVSRRATLPGGATPRQWLSAFAEIVDATAPRIVMPCDDTALRLLAQLAIGPPAHLAPERHVRLAALIAQSLGAPGRIEASIDKTRFCQVAEEAGLRVPPYAVIASPAEAEPFAAKHGWPLVLKSSYSSAGLGVAVCPDRETLAREFARLVRAGGDDPVRAGERSLLLQAHVSGRTTYFAGTAWRGEMLCGYAVDKLEGEAKGPASVVRYYHSDELLDSASRLAAAFDASGIFAPEYVVDDRSELPYLVEVNRRVVPGTHRGAYFGVSTGAALLAAAGGTTPSFRRRLDDGEERIYASFPHEWLRDPESRYLEACAVDVPWDEPELVEAMLAMRHER